MVVFSALTNIEVNPIQQVHQALLLSVMFFTQRTSESILPIQQVHQAIALCDAFNPPSLKIQSFKPMQILVVRSALVNI